MEDAQQLADRYAALWNETDPARRRQGIAALWQPEGEHYVGERKVKGYEALEVRVTGSHEKNVTVNGNRFRTVKDARRLNDMVMFHWQMLPRGGEEVLATGLECLLLDEEGLIRVDYQFVL